eukprot:scaffold659_cov329-Prasinococcus_capsulatus_cf.AAC.16
MATVIPTLPSAGDFRGSTLAQLQEHAPTEPHCQRIAHSRDGHGWQAWSCSSHRGQATSGTTSPRAG